ncbi:MAG: NADP-dependent oxidoreductase [Acidobacteria bacterium]|nr:NADP-dependent oxidoreductase [Acidobacteriota bacterium]MDA1235054.1 NADP-dependent oxidoreductase [Acidobacteriota bacterium]
MRNTQVLFKARPEGWVNDSHFEIVESESRAPREGEVLVRNLYLSVDPYMRGRMRATKSYTPGFELGKPLHGGGVGEIVESQSAKLPVGSYVSGMLGWENYTTAAAESLSLVDPALAPLSAYLGALGMPSMTAWYGMQEIGRAKAGETVVISAASGAVGQIAGQMAKMTGCRVVGTVGSDEKLRYILDELGFDAGINYKTVDSLGAALDEACPEGIDVYFENVGGAMLDAVLARVNPFARIIACGMISQYNLERPEGIHNLMSIIANRVLMQGFIVSDHFARMPEFHAEMGDWLKQGKIKYREDVTQGIENAPAAFIGMLKGKNFGKAVIEIAKP